MNGGAENVTKYIREKRIRSSSDGEEPSYFRQHDLFKNKVTEAAPRAEQYVEPLPQQSRSRLVDYVPSKGSKLTCLTFRVVRIAEVSI